MAQHSCLPIDIRQNGDRISVYVLNGLNLYCYGVPKINARVYHGLRTRFHPQTRRMYGDCKDVSLPKKKKRKKKKDRRDTGMKRAIEATEKDMYDHEQR